MLSLTSFFDFASFSAALYPAFVLSLATSSFISASGGSVVIPSSFLCTTSGAFLVRPFVAKSQKKVFRKRLLEGVTSFSWQKA
jgi:hypothetical protein